MTTPTPLTDRVALVTGASSGIGRAAATALAGAGAHVIALARTPGALADTARTHPRITPHPADLRDADTPARAVDAALTTHGRLDILVNNAGATALMPLADTRTDTLDDLFTLNVTAPTRLTAAALDPLTRTSGAIVNISSTYGHRPMPGAAPYAASKAALESLTRSWALELAPHRIRANAIAPGPTRSNALTAAGLDPDTVTRIHHDETQRIPLGRRGEPHEIATWITHLADPAATWITGQIITVDGGLELT
ncbi:SDR family NAD(P)-dependent oxidoreductase [Streptomonospora wellingtoniae]|uniref:SDR family oxidoreductase n=1 Tax=Streptomonospora wellingtoniae TaxID=3075544 RepID=A0ABU2KWW1_9ACTN|nr:SDR family oxidoreductase [Streptomonospora sp. DSM 45055]MDT0303738.1 SDR family oxidoreductase [Streptomonospora sp. DSM 45055]